MGKLLRNMENQSQFAFSILPAITPVPMTIARRALSLLILALPIWLTACKSTESKSGSSKINAIVSVRDQKMGVYDREGKLIDRYKISTSKFGVGDRPGSCCTPLGRHEIVAKIGAGLPAGAVLKSRHWNGEVLKPNAPGRDPIVSRILWLNGLEAKNRNAYGRFIYIHGTTEENRLGSAASYGCVRMAAADVIKLYKQLGVGSKVTIVTERLPRATSGNADAPPPVAPLPVQQAPIDVTEAATSNIAYQAPSAEGLPPATQGNNAVLSPVRVPASDAARAAAAAEVARPQPVVPGPSVVLKSRGYTPGRSARSDG
jgi:hypothetical protein